MSKKTKATTAAQQQAARDFAADVGIFLRAIRCHHADGTKLLHDGAAVVGWKGLAAVMVADGDLDGKGELTTKGKRRRTRLMNIKAGAAAPSVKPSSASNRLVETIVGLAKKGSSTRDIVRAGMAEGWLVKFDARADERAQAGHYNYATKAISALLMEQGAPVLYPTIAGARSAIARGVKSAGWVGGEAPDFAPPPEGDDEPPKPRGGKRAPKGKAKPKAAAASAQTVTLTGEQLQAMVRSEAKSVVRDMLGELLKSPRVAAKRVDRPRKAARKGKTGS